MSMADLARLGISVGELGRVTTVPNQDNMRVSVSEQPIRSQVKVGNPQPVILPASAQPHEIRISLPQQITRHPPPQDVHRITIPQEYLPKTQFIQATPRPSIPQVSSQAAQFSTPQEMSRISVPGVTQMSNITAKSVS